MAGSLNKCCLIGNVGRDAELKTFSNGQSMARFSLATTETWKDDKGEKQSRTEWHNISVWGKMAEPAAKYITKGKQIYVEGKIENREGTDEQGNKKIYPGVRCTQFVLLGKKDEDERPAGYGEPPPAGAPAKPATTAYDDDIPF